MTIRPDAAVLGAGDVANGFGRMLPYCRGPMAKTEKRLTKRQRKELYGKGPSGTPKSSGSGHIHCVACGRHIDPGEFTRAVPSAAWLTCQHGSRFASCTTCTIETQARLDEHDRTGQPPRVTPAWH